MRAIGVVQLDNSTPIVLSAEKSVTRGTRGMAVLPGFMNSRQEWASGIPVQHRGEPGCLVLARTAMDVRSGHLLSDV